MKKNRFLPFAALIPFAVASCHKDDISHESPKVTAGVYALSEGLFNSNNSTLTYYDISSGAATTDFYSNSNGSGLGDSGNDMLVYGSKIYIVMNGSGYLEVANAFTAKSIKKISFKTAGGANRQPRFAAVYKNKVLVSSYDGTVAVVDTTSLSIDKFITVGANPEQMAVVGDRLYVANSGGLNPVYDSTVSVVDLVTQAETAKIKVGLNPSTLAADNAGNLYVSCTGDYFSVPAKLVKVNLSNNTVIKSADTAVGKFRFYNGSLYALGGYLGVPRIRVLSTSDFKEASPNFVTDGTVLTTPYGLSIDESTGDVYVSDAVDFTSPGRVYCFDKTGKKKFSFSVTPGLNPNTVIPLQQ